MIDKEKESKSLITASESASSINDLNLLDSAQRNQLELYIKSIIGSEKSGIKTIADGIAIYGRARDLNLPFTACVEHIHVINGKTGLDIHLIKALLLRAGITWVCTKDYVPQYEYTDGSNVYIENKLPEYCVICKDQTAAEELTKSNPNDKVGVYPVRFYVDIKGQVYRSYQMDERFVVVSGVREAQAVLQSNQGKIPVYRMAASPVDYVTEYVLTRRKEVLGKVIEIESKGHFSYSEALSAKLFDKDTYVKYARTLIGHRAFTYAARDIASDIIFGVMETTELKIVSDTALDNRDVVDIEATELVD